MNKHNVVALQDREVLSGPLTELLREGARQLINQVVEAELQVLLAQHWQSIRTINPIESTIGTIRYRTKRAKGCLTRDGMLHMIFKPGQCALTNWRRLHGFTN